MTFYRIIEHIIKERILTFKDLSFSRTSRPEYQTAVAMVDGKQYHGGMCDRFKGMVSLYAYCKQRGIEFRILYNYPFDLSEYLVPSSYDWRLKEGEFSGCFRDCRIIYLRGESGHRLTRLRTKKQIHFYGNMDILDVLNKDRGTSYRWGELFKELFRPSEALASQLADLHTGIGEEYDAAVFRFQNLLGDFPEYRFKPLESRQEREKLKEKCLAAVRELAARPENGRKLLVTSDSESFLQEVSGIEGTFVIPGTVVHMDGGGKRNGSSHMKSFLDFFMLTEARSVSCIGTKEMYPSQFPMYAAKVNGIPFRRITLE
ncbi:MAG: hypothetical protein IAB80_10790 [Bacteroidetes bacterium]|uniref:Uncharacterized protein n=1 Tax=Candidatus Cryptobacteroides excrementipullorum TaxID=2840761 RepID=A0A9D9IXI8_9BACT|nr:hypothetical protein [Candidatus Cryptobacteroides excrementipullorum]